MKKVIVDFDPGGGLFDKDMRWTRIHETIKMGVPISALDKDYFLGKLKGHKNHDR